MGHNCQVNLDNYHTLGHIVGTQSKCIDWNNLLGITPIYPVEIQLFPSCGSGLAHLKTLKQPQNFKSGIPHRIFLETLILFGKLYMIIGKGLKFPGLWSNSES